LHNLIWYPKNPQYCERGYHVYNCSLRAIVDDRAKFKKLSRFRFALN